jgi:anti-anti-sigma factor
MPITQNRTNDHIIIAISGRMDARFITEQREVLDQLPSQIDTTVFFDLSATDFIDSSGIGFLVYIYKRIKPQKRQMAIIGLSGQPKDTVEMLRINKLIDCVDNVEELTSKLIARKAGRKRDAILRAASRPRFFKRNNRITQNKPAA